MLDTGKFILVEFLLSIRYAPSIMIPAFSCNALIALQLVCIRSLSREGGLCLIQVLQITKAVTWELKRARPWTIELRIMEMRSTICMKSVFLLPRSWSFLLA
jgi:hypothetical protein